MKVSVCIPTYNGEPFLRPCVKSVLAQTYENFELVICDDASTDGTWDVIQSFSDPRIRTHRSERNGGMAFNWNTAVSFARGKYLKLLCQDDLLDPHCLEMQAAMLDRRPEVVLVTSGRTLLDGNGTPVSTVRWFSREVRLDKVGLRAVMLIYGNIVGEPSAVLMRRESLLKAGPFSSTLPQALDVDMWLRVAELGKIGYLPAPLCSIWQHKLTASNANWRRGVVVKDILAIAELLLEESNTSWCARKVGWGRAAGSVVNQALFGFTYGCIRWPMRALWRAFRVDPGFLAFMTYLILFRSGILGLRSDHKSNLGVCLGSTLHSCVENGGAVTEDS